MSIVFDPCEIFSIFKNSDDESAFSNQNLRYLPLSTRSSHTKTLVLDLDETLVHSSPRPFENSYDDIVTLNKSTESKKVYVKYRPGLMHFLEIASQNFELVIYTASTRYYADQILNKIDPQRRILRHRLYREDCLMQSGHYIKDLTRLGRDLSQVIIMDNSIVAFGFQINNGIPISSWFGSNEDQELAKAELILKKIVEVQDVRPFLNSIFNLPKLIEEYRKSLSVNTMNIN